MPAGRRSLPPLLSLLVTFCYQSKLSADTQKRMKTVNKHLWKYQPRSESYFLSSGCTVRKDARPATPGHEGSGSPGSQEQPNGSKRSTNQNNTVLQAGDRENHPTPWTQPGAPRVILFVSSKQKGCLPPPRHVSSCCFPRDTASRATAVDFSQQPQGTCFLKQRDEERFPEARSVSPRCPAPIARARHLSATHLIPATLSSASSSYQVSPISSTSDFLNNSFIDRYFTYRKTHPIQCF